MYKNDIFYKFNEGTKELKSYIKELEKQLNDSNQLKEKYLTELAIAATFINVCGLTVDFDNFNMEIKRSGRNNILQG